MASQQLHPGDAGHETTEGIGESFSSAQLTRNGRFTQSLYDEAKKDGCTGISMNSDWKRVFAFEQ